jgi:hypothetical protein
MRKLSESEVNPISSALHLAGFSAHAVAFRFRNLGRVDPFGFQETPPAPASKFRFVRFRNRTIGWFFTDQDGFCHYMRMPRG